MHFLHNTFRPPQQGLPRMVFCWFVVSLLPHLGPWGAPWVQAVQNHSVDATLRWAQRNQAPVPPGRRRPTRRRHRDRRPRNGVAWQMCVACCGWRNSWYVQVMIWEHSHQVQGGTQFGVRHEWCSDFVNPRIALLKKGV